MTTDEIIGTLKANIDRPVRVVYTDGQTELCFVHSVDEEGFVNDPLTPDDETYPPEKAGWWTRFEGIAEVHAVEPGTFTVTQRP